MSDFKISELFIRFKLFILIGFLTLLYFFVTTFDSYYDVVNPDSINWHVRSLNFINGLKSWDLSDTYQVYHPGFTLMWIIGPGVYFDSVPYTKDTFLSKDFLAKQLIYVVLAFNFLISLLILRNFLKISSLLLFSALFIFEPFFLGVRRLVHLEGLLVAFLFNSFLFLILYSLKTRKFSHLALSILFFVLAFYTKSSAIILAPLLIILSLFTRQDLKTKFSHIFFGILFAFLFLYIFLPAVWKNPIQKFPDIFTKIYEGASLIGYEGRREVGTSGEGQNLVLNKSKTKVNNFYYDSMLYTLTPTFWILIVSLIPILLFKIIEFFVNKKNNYIKSFRKIASNDLFIISVLSILAFLSFFVIYSLATKSYERYSVILLPFLILLIALAFDTLNLKLILSFLFLYLVFTGYDLLKIRPYYYAYGNSYLGGSFQRYEKLNSPSFGVGIYELNSKLSGYIKENDTEYFPVVSGTKSMKATFRDARIERYPFCDSDYFIQFYDDKDIKEVCISKSHKHLFSIFIGNIEYWKVYKFDRRSSKAKKIIDSQPNKNDENDFEFKDE